MPHAPYASASDEEAVLTGGGLRLAFNRCEGGLAHTVAILDGRRLRPMLASAGCGDGQIRPESPTVQNVHREEREGRNVLLGVGMAGRRHWSLALEFDAATGRLMFDVACRIREPAAPLGSRYRTMVAPAVDAGGTTATLRLDDAACRLEVLRVDRAASCRIEVTEEGIALAVPPASGGATLPVTHRWRYAVRRVV